MNDYAPIKWENDLYLLDQRELPLKETYLKITNLQECFYAIKDMVVRGAPCIGITAIYGFALMIREEQNLNPTLISERANYLISSRPTAVNLSFETLRAKNYVLKMLNDKYSKPEIFENLLSFAHQELDNCEMINLKMAKLSLNYLDQKFKKDKYRFLTHCNTGQLACGKWGSALGVISYAFSKARGEFVYADETRPYLQGSRLTSYELMKQNIPHQIVCEGSASYLFQNNLVDAIYVGADRIAKNGDTANKVGTSTLAIVAKHYKIPFFVVAPKSSFDLSLTSGEEIPIELRAEEEILKLQNIQIAPIGARALNPSFDITKSEFIERIICENGVIDPSQPGMLANIINDN